MESIIQQKNTKDRIWYNTFLAFIKIYTMCPLRHAQIILPSLLFKKVKPWLYTRAMTRQDEIINFIKNIKWKTGQTKDQSKNTM
jgi:hypothetical protein